MTQWKGMAFPVTLENGGVQCSEDIENIRECIWIILSTRRGERVMRPDFGSNFFDLIDFPLNQVFMARLRYEIYQAIEEWEPRVKTNVVQVEINPSNPAQIIITIEIVILKTDTVETVTYIYDREVKKWLK